MTLYQAVLFLHVGGAITTFVGVGAWFFGIVASRRSIRVEELRILAPVFEMGAAVGLLGIVVVAATGLYLAITVWGLGSGWIQVAIGAFALMAPVGSLLVGPRLALLIHEARSTSDGLVSASLRLRQSDPVLRLGIHAIVGDLVGIVFLMTTKPTFAASVAVVIVFVGLALVTAATPFGRRPRPSSMVLPDLSRRILYTDNRAGSGKLETRIGHQGA